MTTGSRNKTYGELLTEYQPRSIQTADDALRVQAVLDAFLDEEDPTEDETAFRNLLGDLIMAWEVGSPDLPGVSPIDRIRALLGDNGLRQKDLVPTVFPTESVASEVLHGKRALTYDFVERLARFFRVPASLFFSALSETPVASGDLAREILEATVQVPQSPQTTIEHVPAQEVLVTQFEDIPADAGRVSRVRVKPGSGTGKRHSGR